MTAPSDFDDATVAAYVDGELDAATRARVDAAASTDETLAARLQAQTALRAMLQAAFDPVAQEPAPDRFLRVVSEGERPAAEVVDLASRRKPPPAPKPAAARFALPAWAGMAACLVLGLAVGRLAMAPPLAVNGRPDQSLIASGPLARALDKQLASDAAGEIRMGVSFKSRDGRYCRAFQPNGGAGLAGVACREQDAWRLRLAMPVSPAAATEYRTAGTETPPAVLSAVDDLIAGPPLDAGAEQGARSRRWLP